ncbi:MAG: GvpL/GvpF family gas vesicle protein [Candidatus Spechtbacterales bacterium]
MALYLYCVREKSSVPFSIKGIGGSERVFTIAYKDLDAVVSVVSPRAFSGEDIEKKAQSDILWIAEKARIHEAILEEAMGSDKRQPVIPLKFGTIFSRRVDLLNSLSLHYDRFSSTLKKLEGKQEWHCKVFLQDARALERNIRLSSKVIREKEKEMQAMNEGAAYFASIEVATRIKQEKDKTLAGLRESIFQTLNRHAETATHGKILAKELTGISESMILNGFFLLRKEKISEFQKTMERLIKKFPTLHFVFRGPWPPYNFV